MALYYSDELFCWPLIKIIHVALVSMMKISYLPLDLRESEKRRMCINPLTLHPFLAQSGHLDLKRTKMRAEQVGLYVMGRQELMERLASSQGWIQKPQDWIVNLVTELPSSVTHVSR